MNVTCKSTPKSTGKIDVQLNDTLEERVTVLEFQVAEITSDITEIVDDVNIVEGEITVISAGQILQDERLLELEMDSDGITCFSPVLFFLF